MGGESVAPHSVALQLREHEFVGLTTQLPGRLRHNESRGTRRVAAVGRLAEPAGNLLRGNSIMMPLARIVEIDVRQLRSRQPVSVFRRPG